ncbi:unnamed protein product [Bursaphelenchus okinawaensis]|uniref:Insulin-like domain-containing protein n=1 Tax=Bursaphelenchus okinawaensis TaxID=465554 RepID=A0A811L3H6_9BILA|nr:unnamed protein product [Bursaphelenchus okinawaensis]CAG9115657.1 unnamed protein product [Bursaphelenchus okinawaensis]
MIITHMKPYLSLFILVLFLLQCTDANFRLCGFKLTTTLQHVCKHQVCGGYQVQTQKRALSDYNNPFFRYQIMGYKRRIPQKRAGVATECCQKRCSLAYLRTYCCAGFE